MSINKPNILVLTSTFPRWQGDKEPPFVFELSKRLINDFNLHILAPHASNAKLEENIADLKITRFKYFFNKLQLLAYNGGILANLKKYPWLYLIVPFFIFSECLSLYKLLKNNAIKIIHAHWIIPQGLVAVLISRLINQPISILCTSHGGDLYGLNNKFFKLLKIYVLKRVHKITVVSHAMYQEVLNLGIAEDKIQIISMGVDLKNQFIPCSQIPKINNSILFVGRLVEKKGVKYLLEAFTTILKNYPNAMLTIVGNGTEELLLKQQTKNLMIEDKVNFLGAVENTQLPFLYQQHEIVVFPSIIGKDGDREGFGLVLVEALGCECAVIATDLPAMQDILTNQINALIVPQKNAAALANKLEQLLENPTLRKQLGQNGRNFVLQNYDWSIISNKYISCFKKL